LPPSRQCQFALQTFPSLAGKYPPVRGMTPTVDDPFADLESDLPWETN
jgi:hypothetical protein